MVQAVVVEGEGAAVAVAVRPAPRGLTPLKAEDVTDEEQRSRK